MRKLPLVAAFLLVAGCGGTATQQAAAPSTTAPPATTSAPPVSTAAPTSAAPEPAGMPVKLASTKLGKVLVNGDGLTLYLFEKDEQGKPTCYDKCAEAWAPYITQGKPQAAEGARAGLVSTVARDDGAMQVVYAGHPLYTYEDDKKPGDVTGNDKKEFGADWYAVKADGKAAE